jgi:hypothetical protein
LGAFAAIFCVTFFASGGLDANTAMRRKSAQREKLKNIE